MSQNIAVVSQSGVKGRSARESALRPANKCSVTGRFEKLDSPSEGRTNTDSKNQAAASQATFSVPVPTEPSVINRMFNMSTQKADEGRTDVRQQRQVITRITHNEIKAMKAVTTMETKSKELTRIQNCANSVINLLPPQLTGLLSRSSRRES